MKIYDTMWNTGISNSCTELFKLLQIIISTPMTTAKGERCSSAFRRVKTILRSTMSQEHLSALAILSAEKVMIENMTNFNEKVIEKSATHK
jgi:hypothetical protein